MCIGRFAFSASAGCATVAGCTAGSRVCGESAMAVGPSPRQTDGAGAQSPEFREFPKTALAPTAEFMPAPIPVEVFELRAAIWSVRQPVRHFF